MAQHLRGHTPKKEKKGGPGVTRTCKMETNGTPKTFIRGIILNAVSILKARAKFQGKGQIAVGGIYHFPNIYSHLTFSTIILNFPARQFA